MGCQENSFLLIELYMRENFGSLKDESMLLNAM